MMILKLNVCTAVKCSQVKVPVLDCTELALASSLTRRFDYNDKRDFGDMGWIANVICFDRIRGPTPRWSHICAVRFNITVNWPAIPDQLGKQIAFPQPGEVLISSTFLNY